MLDIFFCSESGQKINKNKEKKVFMYSLDLSFLPRRLQLFEKGGGSSLTQSMEQNLQIYSFCCEKSNCRLINRMNEKKAVLREILVAFFRAAVVTEFI